MTKNMKQQIAQELLDIKAVTLNPKEPYTWTSGLNAPIYCDNRLIISYPKSRTLVTDGLIQLIEKYYPDVEVIAGTATAGIPHAAFIAQKMNLPMIYVRADSKKHGKHNAIEGTILKNQKVVMIEDLISTGKSVLAAAEKVAETGAEIMGCLAIFNYKLAKAKDNFTRKSYSLHTLTDYPTLIEVALQDKKLQPYKETLNSWYIDPIMWSEKNMQN